MRPTLRIVLPPPEGEPEITIAGPVVTVMSAEQCPCRRCDEARRAVLEAAANGEAAKMNLRMFGRIFIVCPICGNKRCPHATFHGEECTGSNEPGQPGSDYA